MHRLELVLKVFRFHKLSFWMTIPQVDNGFQTCENCLQNNYSHLSFHKLTFQLSHVYILNVFFPNKQAQHQHIFEFLKKSH